RLLRRAGRSAEVRPATAGPAGGDCRRHRFGRSSSARFERAVEEIFEVDRLWRQTRSLMQDFSWRCSVAATTITTGPSLSAALDDLRGGAIRDVTFARGARNPKSRIIASPRRPRLRLPVLRRYGCRPQITGQIFGR